MFFVVVDVFGFLCHEKNQPKYRPTLYDVLAHRALEFFQSTEYDIARPADAGPPRLLTPPLTHQQIADMVGTSRETVTRAIKQLKESGWLLQEGKRYVIPADR